MKCSMTKLMLSIVLITCTCLSAQAELKQVSIGGEIRIRYSDWDSTFNSTLAPTFVTPEVRYNAASTFLRPIGDFLGGSNVTSYYGFNNDSVGYSATEQRTRLNVTADFSDDVSAFIEIESWNYWGENFRSDYITGLDFAGASEVSLYQSYINAENMWGTNLDMRIGRQEITLGNKWLMGNNDNTLEFPGLSFDGIRFTYDRDKLTVDAFYAKLVETFGEAFDDDVNLAGVYVTYAAKDSINVDGYWLFLHDSRSVTDTTGFFPLEVLEDFFGLDDYESTKFHTVGARLYGQAGGFDYNAEGAYQFGTASSVGFLFRNGLYGDDDADYDAWGAHAELGYTLDVKHTTRLYVLGAYLSGEDNRDLTLLEWLNPFRLPESSISFNRLFSDQVYSRFLDDMAKLSNVWTAQAGVSVAATDKIDVAAYGAYFQVNETFDRPLAVNVLGTVVPIAGPFSFLTNESDDELGWEIGVSAKYRYTEDLVFSAGYSHFFLGDGLEDGSYTDMNGLLFGGGSDNEDPGYIFAEATIKF